jgi:hypothetical protein
MTRGIRLFGLAALAFVAALVAFVSSQEGKAQQGPPFDPGGVLCFEVMESADLCDGDTAPGATTDIRSRFCIGWNDDCTQKDDPVVDTNFGGIVAFTPNEWNVPRGDELPVGAIAGRLTSQATLGLLNNPCSSVINVAFTLMNGSVNTADTVSPKAVGQPNPLEPLALDTNNNGIPDGADKYPSFLATVFPDIQPRARLFGTTFIQGSWVTLNFVFFEPATVLRAGGGSLEPGATLGYPSVTILNDPTAPPLPGPISDFCAPLLSENVTMGLTLNNPCTPTPVARANCPGVGAPLANLGYPLFPCESGNAIDEDNDGFINDGCPMVNVVSEADIPGACNNDISDDPEDSAINDGCPQVGDVSEGERIPGACSGGDEGGCVNRSNPEEAGTYVFTTYSLSLPDADGDGIENQLDVCALDANPGWEPRGLDPVNDPDNDGLPNECDPQPNTMGPGSPPGCPAGYVGADEDGDCFSNRADNCPTNSQLPNPGAPPGLENLPNLADSDGDGIGDACDPNPQVQNGARTQLCVEFPMEAGGPGGPVVRIPSAIPAPQCVGGTLPDPDTTTPTPAPPTPEPTPTPTPGPGVTPTPRPAPGVGPVGAAPGTGVGSLAPVNSGIPLWAALLSLTGGLGVIGGFALLANRMARRE